MNLARPLGALAVVVTVAFALGSVASLVSGPVVGQNALPSIATVSLMIVAVVVATLAGVRSKEWLENSGYW
jgi:hypothetical protein